MFGSIESTQQIRGKGLNLNILLFIIKDLNFKSWSILHSACSNKTLLPLFKDVSPPQMTKIKRHFPSSVHLRGDRLVLFNFTQNLNEGTGNCYYGSLDICRIKSCHRNAFQFQAHLYIARAISKPCKGWSKSRISYWHNIKKNYRK